MQLFYHHGYNNFGDVLNSWLWEKLIPGLGSAGDDAIVFSGIGSILNDRLPNGRLNIVFGSGAGYGAIPEGRNWVFYAVRGPQTARIFHLSDIALGDPALLLPRLMPVTDSGSGRVAFVPHRETAALGGWSGPCETLGIDYIDPCGDTLDVVRRIASARLVITESLHGGIVADAYRVPWVPVTIFHSHPFKWRDWLGALDLEYAPRPMDQNTVRQFQGAGLRQAWALQAKLDRRGRRSGLFGKLCSGSSAGLLKAMRAAFLNRASTIDQRVRDLEYVMKNSDPKLSADDVLAFRQQGLLDQVERFRNDWKL